MKREILFRAMDADGTWHLGTPIIARVDAPHFDVLFGSDRKQHEYCLMMPHGSFYEIPKPVVVKYSTLGQYTGLKDRNGVRIFEGDKLDYYEDGKYNGADMEVVFHNGKFVKDCIVNHGYKYKSDFDQIDADYIEVIGNKWGNG